MYKNKDMKEKKKDFRDRCDAKVMLYNLRSAVQDIKANIISFRKVSLRYFA